jgi:hypothetical protein
MGNISKFLRHSALTQQTPMLSHTLSGNNLFFSKTMSKTVNENNFDNPV